MKITIYQVRIIFFVIAVCLLHSCKKDNTSVKKVPDSFNEVFDAFWDGMNQNYLFWDIDTTNWDAMYNRYRPLFQKLNLKNDEDVRKSVGYFKQMTKGLIDGHFNIRFTHPAITDSIVYPAFESKQKLPDFHYPYSYIQVDTQYLDKGFRWGSDNNFSTGGIPLTVIAGTINHSILYFSCNEFSLLQSYHSKTPNKVQAVIEYFFNILSDIPDNITGIIIDVRSNLGGDVADLQFLLSPLIDQSLCFGYTQYKSGNGRLDYTPWIKACIHPGQKTNTLTVPIVALADHVSASLSEIVAMSIHSLPNGQFIGETTWGATAPVVNEETYNAGPFTVPHFLSVQTSSGKFKYIDGKIYEGKGFPPDIHVPFNLSALQNGHDPSLEKAIDYITHH